LVPLADCDQAEQAIRVGALQKMHKMLDQQRDSMLKVKQSCGRTTGGEDDANGFGTPGASSGAAGAGGSAPNGSGGTKSAEDGASQVSGTNNQIAGVDEADFIKNDNKYVYILAGNAFRIVDAWPAEQTHEIAKVAVEGTPKNLFVEGDRALVYSSLPGVSGSAGKTSGGGYQPGACTYGYDCEFTGDGHPLKISVFDITDKTAPKLVRELKLTGSYVNSRRIGHAVHTVVSDPGASFPKVKYAPGNLPYCDASVSEEDIVAAFDLLRADNIRTIMTAPLSSWLPTITDTTWVDGQPQTTSNVMAGCTGFYRSAIADGSTFTTVMSFDMTVETTPVTATVVSRPGAVFASSSALYMSVPEERSAYGGWYEGAGAFKQASTVHKFRLGNERASVGYAGSGVVKGKVLNQFSMDEYDGHLRIATSTGKVPDPSVHSTVSVLREERNTLVTVGVVDNIAPHEDIRSVRFSGERGFVVTFKKTDPLFVLDLASPERPAILGELKIPGFSTYMHMLDPTHVLSIGYDAQDMGSYACFAGVMLQIFDVTVLSDPQLMHKYVIGTRGSSSDALTDHLAFNYFPAKKLLAVPMTVCEGGNGCSYGMTMTFSGLQVYDVTLASGFALRGQVAHPSTSSGSGYNNSACSNWWTNANSAVKRSVFMDDFVYSVSEMRMKVNHLSALATDVAVVPFTN
jgi:hypothetical protein